MLPIIFTLILATLCSAQEPWTKDETVIVKDKIRFVFTNAESVKEQFFAKYPEHEFKQIFTELFSSETFPTAAKVLRLGFHDCLPYEDAQGAKNGCDGCLNSKGMGSDQIELAENQGLPGPGKFSTDNNGLWWTAEILEEIYTNPTFPTGDGIKDLGISLKEAGKSRADLWAFATLVATEFGLEEQNRACSGDQLMEPGCGHQRQLEADCQIPMPRKLRFKTGRQDCSPDPSLPRPFFTSKKEVHPSLHTNGVDTVDFYKQHFGLTAQAAIALHGGAHSFGAFHDSVSLLRYQWTKHQTHLINNQFFKILALRPEYYPMCKNGWHLLPDVQGNPGATRWLAKIVRMNVDGGPYFQWWHLHHKCARSSVACSDMISPRDGPPWGGFSEGCCNETMSTGLACNAACDEADGENDQETAILPDVGLFWHFDVDPVTGAPINCPGFSSPRWISGQMSKTVPDCGKEMYAPEGKPLSEIVESYADDQDFWISAFFDAIEDMLANGYKKSQLVKAPGSWFTN